MLRHLHRLAFFHQAFGFDQRGQWFGGEFACLGLRHGIHFGGRHDAVDQANLQRGLSHEGFTQQQRFCRAVVTKHLRQQQAGRCFGAQAQVHERQRKRCVVARVHQVAVQQHRRANTHGRATHGGHDRFRECGDAMQEPEDR